MKQVLIAFMVSVLSINVTAADLCLDSYQNQPRGLFLKNTVADNVYFVVGDTPYLVSPDVHMGENRELNKMIEFRMNQLRELGYKVHFVKKIEVADLVLISSDPSTLAIFHFGHGLYYQGRGPFISAFSNGKESLVTEGTVDHEKNNLPMTYVAGKNLELFYTAACHGGRCEAGLRNWFAFPQSMQYVAPARGGEIKSDSLALSLADNTPVDYWIRGLKDISKRPPTSTLSLYESKKNLEQNEKDIKISEKKNQYAQHLSNIEAFLKGNENRSENRARLAQFLNEQYSDGRRHLFTMESYDFFKKYVDRLFDDKMSLDDLHEVTRHLTNSYEKYALFQNSIAKISNQKDYIQIVIFLLKQHSPRDKNLPTFISETFRSLNFKSILEVHMKVRDNLYAGNNLPRSALQPIFKLANLVHNQNDKESFLLVLELSKTATLNEERSRYESLIAAMISTNPELKKIHRLHKLKTLLRLQ